MSAAAPGDTKLAELAQLSAGLQKQVHGMAAPTAAASTLAQGLVAASAGAGTLAVGSAA